MGNTSARGAHLFGLHHDAASVFREGGGGQLLDDAPIVHDVIPRSLAREGAGRA